MKTAQQRADEIADRLGVGKYDAATREDIRRSFLEYARDQRHACAEAVPGFGDAPKVHPNPLEAHAQALSAAHAAVMNTPFPGEGPNA